MGTLRFMLAFFVVWGHIPTSIKLLPADMAVQIFFVISGFYMALILNTNPAYLERKVFWGQRALRIFPLYLTVLLLTSIFYAWMYWAGHEETLFVALRNATSHPLVLIGWVFTQVFIVGQDFFFYFQFSHEGDLLFLKTLQNAENPANQMMLLGQAWTLSLELMFYALAPYVLRRSNMILMRLCLASTLFRLFLQWQLSLSGDPWSYRFFPSELSFFLLGAIGYKLLVHDSRKGYWNVRWLQYSVIVSLVIASVVVNRAGFLGAYWINPGFFVMWVVLVFLPILFTATKNISLDKLIGELSFPLYISHLLLIVVFTQLFGVDVTNNKPVTLVAAVVFAALLYILVDKPMDIYRHLIINSKNSSRRSNVLASPESSYSKVG